MYDTAWLCGIATIIVGKDLLIQGELYTPREFVDIVRKVTGRDITYVETTRERFESMKTVIPELWNKCVQIY